MITSAVNIPCVIIDACKAIIAITSSMSPFGVSPRPTIIPSCNEPLLRIVAIAVPPIVPISAIKRNIKIKLIFPVSSVRSVLTPI